jgi:hypothetical protein
LKEEGRIVRGKGIEGMTERHKRSRAIRRKVLWGLASLIAFGGCASLGLAEWVKSERLGSFVPKPGTPADEVRARYGTPDSIVPMPDGEERWYYYDALGLIPLLGVRFDSQKRVVFWWVV